MTQLNLTVANSLISSKSLSKVAGDPTTLPERVLQFGTGVLLRGLPLYFIEKANQHGVFGGRVVIVKSTNTGGTEAFDKQNGLYTLNVRGIEAGKEVKEAMLVSAISRVLSASTQWQQVLGVAEDPHVEIVISNTTEVGIMLDDREDLNNQPPFSFPGKLTALLYRRFQYFRGDPRRGWTILPTELVSDNGNKLKEIVISLARTHGLGEDFINWLDMANDFCTTLVDRIVPGKLPVDEIASLEQQWGYRDELAIMAEPYRLWAIEPATDRIRKRLSFSQVDPGLVLVDNINKFKELKLRLLNGTHTFSCALAVLCGYETVKAAMQDHGFGRYVRMLMSDEIVPAIVGGTITEDEATAFGRSVSDRFSNPFLEHQWMSISLHYTAKMAMRNVALIRSWMERGIEVPSRMALGFAAYLLFMKCTQNIDGLFIGRIGTLTYPIQDEQASYFAEVWAKHNQQPSQVVNQVLAEESLWGHDLSLFSGFADSVSNYLQQLLDGKAKELIDGLN